MALGPNEIFSLDLIMIFEY